MLHLSFSSFICTPDQAQMSCWGGSAKLQLSHLTCEGVLKVDLSLLRQDGSECLLHASEETSTVVLGLNVPCGDTQSSEKWNVN